MRDKLYEEFQVPFLGKEFVVSFELFINKLAGDHWQNVIHVTTDGNNAKMGDRIPGVWILGGRYLAVISAINGTNEWKNVGTVEENKWIKVDISQKPTADKKV